MSSVLFPWVYLCDLGLVIFLTIALSSFFAGTSLAAKFLRAHGITLTKVREECIKLLEKGDEDYSVQVEPSLTESARKALDWAVNHKLNSGTPFVITETS